MTDTSAPNERPERWHPDPPSWWLRLLALLGVVVLGVWCWTALSGTVAFAWPLMRQTLAVVGLVLLVAAALVVVVRRFARPDPVNIWCYTCHSPYPYRAPDGELRCWNCKDEAKKWPTGRVVGGETVTVGTVRVAGTDYWRWTWYVVATAACLLLTLVWAITVVAARPIREHDATKQYRAAVQSLTALEECADTLSDAHADGETLFNENPTDSDDVLAAAERAIQLNLSNQEYVTAAICMVESMRDAFILLYEGRAADLANTVRETGRRAWVNCRHQRDRFAEIEADLWERERQWRSFERLTVGFGEAELTALDIRNSGAIFNTLQDWPVMPEITRAPFWGDGNTLGSDDLWVITDDPARPWDVTVSIPDKETTRTVCGHRHGAP